VCYNVKVYCTLFSTSGSFKGIELLNPPCPLDSYPKTKSNMEFHLQRYLTLKRFPVREPEQNSCARDDSAGLVIVGATKRYLGATKRYSSLIDYIPAQGRAT
jgi:hypothetical protein